MTPVVELQRVAALVRTLQHCGTLDPNAREIAETLQVHAVRGPMGMAPEYCSPERVRWLVKRIREAGIDDLKLPMGQPQGTYAIRAAFADQAKHELERLRDTATSAQTQ
jgi:hypothetical protein